MLQLLRCGFGKVYEAGEVLEETDLLIDGLPPVFVDLPVFSQVLQELIPPSLPVMQDLLHLEQIAHHLHHLIEDFDARADEIAVLALQIELEGLRRQLLGVEELLVPHLQCSLLFILWRC